MCLLDIQCHMRCAESSQVFRGLAACFTGRRLRLAKWLLNILGSLLFAMGTSLVHAQTDTIDGIQLVLSGQINRPTCQIIPVVNEGQAVRLPRLPYDANTANSFSSTALFSIVLTDSTSNKTCGVANSIASIEFDLGPGHDTMLDLLKPQLRSGALKNTYFELLIFSPDWSQSQVIDMRSRTPISMLSMPGWASAPKDSQGKLNLGIRLSKNAAQADIQSGDNAAYGSFYIALPFVIALN